MKLAILAFVGASASLFGGSIALTGTSSTATFTPGTPNMLTFLDGEVAGVFTAIIPVTWDFSGGPFIYNDSMPALIPAFSSGASFSLTADAGADQITGEAQLLELENVTSPADSAVILGVLNINTIAFGTATVDTELENLLTADLGGPLTAGEQLSVAISVVGCNNSGTPAVCIAPADPTGSVAGVALATVPDPGTLGLLGSGLGALLFAKRRLTGRVI
jgi:hypothetical protein